MLTTLTTVNWIAEADLICAKLEASGITATVPDQGTAVTQPMLGSALGGIRIQVEEADLMKARSVLERTPPSTARGLFQCPNCHSVSVAYENVSRRFAFLSLLLLGLPLPWFTRRCKCNDCGHKWKPPVQQSTEQ